MAPTRSSNTGVKKRRGRPSNASKEATARSAPVRAREPKKSETQSRKRPKQSTQDRSREKPRSGIEKETESTKAQKRTADDADLDEIAHSEPTAKDHVQLIPAKRRITQEAMQSWPEITQPILRQVVMVLRDARVETVASRRDTRRQDEANIVLGAVVQKLEQKLLTARVPPNAKDEHFNLNRLTELNDRMHRQVMTGHHAVQLLEERVGEAKRTLQRDEKKLEGLKHDVDTWKAQWKRQEKKTKLHPLLAGETEVTRDRPEDIGLKKSATKDASWLDVPEDDPQLGDLLEQLRRSLETMQGNHAQVDGIDEAMRFAQVALDDILFKHASARQYDAL
ncbi:CENP-Q, a CENPA-CAD centromere complex subunit-domain-containing protein [Lophiotrema nucula]|uniref:CENP-Q, a CENPA-CAD centromere complex subunit-domain-containing protein n=1 Tax=Lophiotrema nucula TaxID=690887 RepID=A0A6A5Z6N6_9PLEO|nr:CENP-Q, a CENPA-CAD centromere complex subunit-domain-containing protein [Lophiotrema nucula]